MMASLGPVNFNLKTDLSAVSETEKSHFAAHDVFGAPPAYEDTGDDEGTLTLSGTLRPFLIKGALGGLQALRTMRAAKMPVPFMWGNYRPKGFYIIDQLSIDHSTLDPHVGIGHEIDFEVELLKADAPTTIGGIASLLRLFG